MSDKATFDSISKANPYSFASFLVRPRDKKQVVLNAGHLLPLKDVIRETLDWLDHYLGPVTTTR